jgi:hypothetical protein
MILNYVSLVKLRRELGRSIFREDVGSSQNTLNTTPKKTGRLD